MKYENISPFKVVLTPSTYHRSLALKKMTVAFKNLALHLFREIRFGNVQNESMFREKVASFA